MIIRPMTFEDLDRVLEIEHACFSDPWHISTFRIQLMFENAIYVVADDGGKMLGYAGMLHIVDEGEILNVAVCPNHRQRGAGNALILHLIEIAKQKGAVALTLEVRASNTAAKELYKKHRFEDVGLRKEYYKNPTEDAIIMRNTNLQSKSV